MCDSNGIHVMMEVVGQVLIRCFFMGVLVLFFWWGALVLMGDFVYNVHTWIIPLSRQGFNSIHYAGMLMTKTAIFVVFLFPYISIRLVISKRCK